MSKLLKNKKNVLIIFIAICFVFLIFLYNCNTLTNSNYIDKILKTEAYEYLPNIVKKYIEDVYKDTGEILLTEKNKQDNKPYLNPDYIEYLSYLSNYSSNEYKDGRILNYDVIPNETVVDYVYTSKETTLSNVEIPSKFDLRNVDGKNFVTSIKDQDGTGLCWAFATNAQAESYLLIKNNVSYSNGISNIFSEMQIDYASADNGIIDSSPMYNHNRNLGDGGNFSSAISPMIDGLGLVDVKWRDFNEYDYKAMEKNKVYRFNNSKYEVISTVDYPNLNLNELDLSKQEDIDLRNSYLDNLKQLIMENGGAYVGTVDPTGYCSISVNGYRFMYNDGKCSSAGHAMQIIGWDDDFEYSFCSGTKNDRNYYYLKSDTSSCDGGTVITGKGAWLIKNSWGTSSPYVYLAYDSMKSSISMISGLDSKDWDNYSSYKVDQKGYITYKTIMNNSQKLNKIKIKTSTQAHNYDIYIGPSNIELTRYKTIEVTFPGIYTVDFKEDNIVINDGYVVQVKSSSGNIRPQTINIYTDNIDNEMQVITDDIYYENSLTNINKYVFRISSKTANVEENTIVDYKILKDGKEIETNYSYSENVVFANQIFSKLEIDNNLPHGTYTLNTIINNKVVSESKMVVNNDIIVTEGSGTEEDPYIINTPEQLNLIRLDRFAFYKLGQDIDLTYHTQNENGLFYNNGKGFEPIRYSNYSLNNGHYVSFSKGFSGGFDGNNHKIIGLYINRPDEYGVGLFANIYNENFSNLHIKNITLVNPNITGKSWVGSILGVAYGTTYERQLELSNIQVIGGSIKGDDYVGGVIGLVNAGSYLKVYGTTIDRHIISNLYNSATVTANNYAGGIFGMVTNIDAYGEGRSPINIYNLLNKGNIISDKNASGIAGYIITRAINDISINNSINTGVIEGDICSNQIVCEFSDKSEGNLYLKNIYYTKENELSNEKIITNNVSKKELNDIKDSNEYLEWTTFNNDWKIESKDGITRMPVLKFMNFDYTSIDDITLNIGKQVSIYDFIKPNISSAKNIEYDIQDTNIISINEKGIITGKKLGETTVHIISYYDGYENDIKVNVLKSKSTITFETNGGSKIGVITNYVGERITEPSIPIKDNYIFDGWYLDNGVFEKKYEFNVMPEQNITLYAKWISLDIEVKNYSMNDNKIINISNNTSISKYLSNFIYDKDIVVNYYNEKDELVKEDNISVGTGSKIKFYNNNKLLYEYQNVVRSDITGDGNVDLADLSKLFNYYRGNITMSEIYMLAGDVTNDSKVDLADLSKLFNYYRGNIKDI